LSTCKLHLLIPETVTE